MKYPFDNFAIKIANEILLRNQGQPNYSDVSASLQAAWDSLVERKLVDQHERIKQLEKQGSVFSEFCSMKTQDALLHFGEMNAGELRLFKALQMHLKSTMDYEAELIMTILTEQEINAIDRQTVRSGAVYTDMIDLIASHRAQSKLIEEQSERIKELE
jgi:hypothetical protein